MATVLGIDEAGRGAVIGPMVVAGVLADEGMLPSLVAAGVRDSKLLSHRQRERLAPLIKRTAKDYVVLKVPATKIDELRKIKSLNRIEAELIAQIIKVLRAPRAYVDAPQVSLEKFKRAIQEIAKTRTQLVVENYADRRYAIVAAASILAKVERDAAVRKIEKRYGIRVRTGYPHDPSTIAFLTRCRGKYPPFVRKSWATVIELAKKSEQRSLLEFRKK
jgi:ribonuclease HII